MLKRVRIKFITVTMSITVILLAAICSAILISVYARNEIDAYATLALAVKHRHNLPEAKSSIAPIGAMDDVRSFTVEFADRTATVNYMTETGNSSEERQAYIKQHCASINYYDRFYENDDQIIAYAEAVLRQNKARGKTSDIRFITVENGDGVIIAGIDRSLESDMFSNLTLAVLLIGLGSIGLLFVIVYLFSGWVVRPAKEAFEKQKNFIADAGHEFKTPVTVISASCDLLESELEGAGVNSEKAAKWLKNIKSQTALLTDMTNGLAGLSKLDDDAHNQIERFCVSDTVSGCAAAFDSVAFEAGKRLSERIAHGIIYYGSADAVKQAVAILLDNAVKHSGAGADIIVSLTGTSHPAVSVYNNRSGFPRQELKRIFERFYRSPSARARTQGSGLGLSILQVLAARQRWKLSVKAEPEDTITFTIYL